MRREPLERLAVVDSHPEQFGANAAWVRLIVILYNLFSALKRPALPAELFSARRNRVRFSLFNTIGRVVGYAHEPRSA